MVNGTTYAKKNEVEHKKRKQKYRYRKIYSLIANNRYRAPSLLNKLSVSILRNALIKVLGSWTVSGTSFTPSMSCLRGLPQLSGDFYLLFPKYFCVKQ